MAAQPAGRLWRRSRGARHVLPVALLTLIPLAVVLASFLRPQPEVWAHLTAYVLPDVVKNSLLLACGVGTGVFALGVSLAWLTAQCDFPGRRVFAWALMLPLAMPAYVLAFVQVGLFEYTGPVQTAWRALGGDPAWMPQVRSLPGAVVVLSLAFYPYVYLLAREAFLSQGRRALEAAQTLGYSRRAAFWRLALPMARPWIAGGLVLALMETLADFGAVSIFNLDTFTTAIYKAWFALFNLNAAAQLASLLALAVLALAAGEQWARGRRQYHVRAAGSARHALSGAARAAASIYCAGVLGLAFVLPLLQLLAWAGANWQSDLDARYAGFVWHSIVLAASAALCVAACALVLAQARRAHPDPLTTWLVRLSTLGYALPGAVLAVGVFVPVAWLDGWLVPLAQHWGLQGWQVASGTLVVMLAALTARFMAVGFQPVDAALQRITRNQEYAARSLGLTPRQTVRRLYIPMLRGGVLTALAMVFVDVMKEMPITLMTRPFGWDSLAVRVFEMTSEGMWERAALPSLCIVLAGILPAVFLAGPHRER